MAMARQFNNQAVQALPDPSVCRAVELNEFAECLTDKPAACKYAIPFGFTFLCAHPDRNAIIANARQYRSQMMEQNGSSDQSD